MINIDFKRFNRIFDTLQLEEKIFIHNTFANNNNEEIFLHPMCDYGQWVHSFNGKDFKKQLNFINFNSRHNFYTCDKDYNIKSVTDNEALELVNKYRDKIFEDKETMNYVNDYLKMYISKT